MTAPDTPRAPVETKVTAATVTVTVLSVIAAVANTVQDNPGLISFLPPAVQALVIAVLPPVLVFLAGWAAPHSPR